MQHSAAGNRCYSSILLNFVVMKEKVKGKPKGWIEGLGSERLSVWEKEKDKKNKRESERGRVRSEKRKTESQRE